MTNSRAVRGHNSGNKCEQLSAITYRPVDALKPYGNNPRKHSQRQIAKLAGSIRAYGFLVPILIDPQQTIFAGEARWHAAKELGLSEIPTIDVSHLSGAQIKAYRLVDNRLGELSEWDRGNLAVEIQEIIDLGEIEVDTLGWDIGEIDLLLSEAGSAASVDADPADDAVDEGLAVTRAGDLWTMDRHRLRCGSSRDAIVWNSVMDGGSAAMMFTDPPYNVKINGHVSGTGKHREFAEASGEMSSAGFIVFLTEAIGAAVEHVKDGGIVDLCMDHKHLPELFEAASRCRLAHQNLCVWNKGTGGMGSLYRSQHELVLIAKKGKAPHTNNVQLGKFGRNRTNVWDYPGANGFGRNRASDLADHPTVKPTALVADAILDVTKPGDIVLDGFLGSGTTLLAAERTKRICFGVEIDPGYVDVAIRRWERMTGRQAILLATGETFAEVRDRRCDEQAETPPDPAVASAVGMPTIRHRARPLVA